MIQLYIHSCKKWTGLSLTKILTGKNLTGQRMPNYKLTFVFEELESMITAIYCTKVCLLVLRDRLSFQTVINLWTFYVT